MCQIYTGWGVRVCAHPLEIHRGRMSCDHVRLWQVIQRPSWRLCLYLSFPLNWWFNCKVQKWKPEPHSMCDTQIMSKYYLLTNNPTKPREQQRQHPKQQKRMRTGEHTLLHLFLITSWSHEDMKREIHFSDSLLGIKTIVQILWKLYLQTWIY